AAVQDHHPSWSGPPTAPLRAWIPVRRRGSPAARSCEPRDSGRLSLPTTLYACESVGLGTELLSVESSRLSQSATPLPAQVTRAYTQGRMRSPDGPSARVDRDPALRS